MIEAKIVKKVFGFAEFPEEEKWLEEQHKNGWKLIKTNKNKYQFESCEASDWIYQLDFIGNNTVKEDYIQMFKDCGWEYVLQYDKWYYFRKKKEAGVDLSIFSDRSSRIDMYTRMLRSRQLIAVVVLFVIACIIEWLSIFTDVFSGNSFIDGAMPWIGVGLFVATSFSAYQYIKLRKMLGELKYPEE